MVCLQMWITRETWHLCVTAAPLTIVVSRQSHEVDSYKMLALQECLPWRREVLTATWIL